MAHHKPYYERSSPIESILGMAAIFTWPLWGQVMMQLKGYCKVVGNLKSKRDDNFRAELIVSLRSVLPHTSTFTGPVNGDSKGLILVVDTPHFTTVCFETYNDDRLRSVPYRLMLAGKHIRIVICTSRERLFHLVTATVLHDSPSTASTVCSFWSDRDVPQAHLDQARNTCVRWGGAYGVVAAIQGYATPVMATVIHHQSNERGAEVEMMEAVLEDRMPMLRRRPRRS